MDQDVCASHRQDFGAPCSVRAATEGASKHLCKHCDISRRAPCWWQHGTCPTGTPQETPLCPARLPGGMQACEGRSRAFAKCATGFRAPPPCCVNPPGSLTTNSSHRLLHFCRLTSCFGSVCWLSHVVGANLGGVSWSGLCSDSCSAGQELPTCSLAGSPSGDSP